MGHDVARFAAVFLASLAVAEATLPAAYRHAASHVALALLSLLVADLGLALLGRILPRRLLPDLGGRAVLVTGCDSGFGQQCARRLDALGVTVYAGCLMPQGTGAAALKASTSSRLHIVPLDVTKDDSVQAAVRLVKGTIGDKVLWAVVNNAGVLSVGELHWTSTEEISKVFDVNVFGMVRVTKAFLDMLIESKGRVACICSIAGRVTMPPLLAYSMSKHAVVAFADGLRRQMSKWSVSVHCIEPLFYKTNITNDEIIRSNLKRIWKDCPSAVRMQYGDEFFDKYTESYLKMLVNFNSSNTQAVVDAMVDAAVGAQPKVKYTCGIFSPWILQLVPNTIMDVILYYLTPVGCQPTALQSKNGMTK
ncbi:retinol dehydrogenase 7-like [Bacillus rossius redtenbacheri]|uniref:retinol dehydrogenase 7-like n=1 Tax=Bacillus rossius redtenbacheri TaxID=93214 RepID=UPI002FDC844D